MAAKKKAPAKKAVPTRKPPEPPAPKKGNGRTDRYGASGMGQTGTGVRRNFDERQEAVGRSALKGISGKKPRKGETLTGSETDLIRYDAIKGLGLTRAQIKYVEQQMRAVPYRPKKRK